MNYYAIGDIHGLIRPLDVLTAHLSKQLSRDDVVIFLGDYIDRGPNSKEVISHLINFKKSYTTICLLGNHEDMFMSYMNIEGAMFGSAFIQNGGDATIQSFYPNEILRYWNSTKEFKDYAENFASRFREDFPEHYDFLNSLKLYHDTPEALFVHAAVNSHLALEEQTKFTLIWADDNRNAFFARIKTKPWSKLVVHAHTPIPRNEVLSNLPVRINVDTGAAKGRALTCVKLNSTEPAKSDIIQIDISSLRIKC